MKLLIRKPSLYKNLLSVSVVLLPLLVMALLDGATTLAQATATAVPLLIPTLTPTIEIQVTEPPTRTATAAAISNARVEARDKETGANVRSAPDVNSEKLGTIFPGQFFSVIGRYQQWLQILYDKSSNGRAWIFEGVVNVTGLDPAQIPTILPNALPSPNVATGAAQQTAAVLQSTPGAGQTATVLQASATGVFTATLDGSTSSNNSAIDPNEPLPTFTFPPPFVEATLPPRFSASTSQGGIPPIVPIIVLGGIGLFGLFVSALRRM
jgi:hypothetical protein